MIVLSRFLARPQKRGRRNQLICRGLIKTKKSIGPSKQSDAWSLDDIRIGYWGLCEPYSRKNPRRATAPAYARTLARSLARFRVLLPVIPRSLARSLVSGPCVRSFLARMHISPQTYDSAIIWAPTMKKLTAQNGKIRIICDGYRYRKDVDLAGGGSSFRCLRSACRGRMKIDEDDKVLSSTEHNHEPEVDKARQIATPAGKWMLVEPLSKTDEISYSPHAKASTKDAAVQTEPKDFSWN